MSDFSLIHTLEFVKYHTLFGRAIKHSSPSAEYVDYEDVQIDTPEGKSFLVKNMRFNYFKPQEKEDCYLKVKWGNTVMEPSLSEDTNNPTNDKVYIFHSEQFDALDTETKQSEIIFFKNNVSKGGFWGHAFSVVIQIDGDSKDKFEEFMNLPYGDEKTTGSWKERFNHALENAKNGDPTSLLLYDPRIFENEISIDDKIILLKKYIDEIDFSPEFILGILKTNDKKQAIRIYNEIQNTDLNYKIWRFFTQYVVGQPYFLEYNSALIKMSQNVISNIQVESIGAREVEAYKNYTNKWELFHKLASDANTFAISSDYLNVKFGILNYQAELSNVINEPFLEHDKTKINFSYRAFSIPPPDSEFIRVGTGLTLLPPFINLENFNAFEIVKVYIVDKPTEISKIDNYEKFLKHFFAKPEDYANANPKSTSEFVRFGYMPAICAYNLYLMNNARISFEIMQQMLGTSLLSIAPLFELSGFGGFLAGVDYVTAVVNITLNMPGVKEEILSKYGANGQKFLDACDTLSTITMGLNLAYGGFYGARNIVEFITKRNLIKEAAQTFSQQYMGMTANLRKILEPYYEIIYKNIGQTIEEVDEYLLRLQPMLQEGKSYEWIIAYKKANGFFPNPSQYIKPEVLAQYMADLQAKEVAFFISKREIVDNLKYTELQQSKFAGFTEDMEKVRANFEFSGKDIDQLINDLKVAQDKFTHQDEIYLVYVKADKGFTFTMTTGNEPGVNEFWFKPGGILPNVRDLVTGLPLKPREAIINNANIVVHNNSWNTFVSFFGTSNVKKIYP